MMQKLKSKKGLTLLELVLAMALVGVISVPLSVGFTSVIRFNVMGKHQTEENMISRMVRNNIELHERGAIELAILKKDDDDSKIYYKVKDANDKKYDNFKFSYSNDEDIYTVEILKKELDGDEYKIINTFSFKIILSN